MGRNWVTRKEWVKEYVAKASKPIVSEVDFGRFGRLTDKARLFINTFILRAKQMNKEIESRCGRLIGLFDAFISTLTKKGEELGAAAAQLSESLKTYREKIIQPKFALSAILTILILLSSFLLLNGKARADLANWANDAANFVYLQGKNISIAVDNIGSSIKNAGSATVEAVSQAPQFIEETTQNIEELPFLISSTAQKTVPTLKDGAEISVKGLQKGIESVLVAIEEAPGKVISFARESKKAFARASRKNEEIKFALKSNLKDGFIGFRSKVGNLPDQTVKSLLKAKNLPSQFAELGQNLYQKIEQVKVLPRQISQWGRGLSKMTILYISDVPSDISKKIANTYLSSINIVQDLSDTLSDTPQRAVNKTKNAISRPAKTTANLFDSISNLGEKIIQVSTNIKSELGDTYIKVAEFLIPGYSFDETAELLPQRTVITKIEEPIIQEVVKQVQQITPKVVITEVTKEKVIEITETVQSAD
ncbi:MAG: hypothetical protein L6275_04835, partial [Candidatus Portnoybacteria bacterium]|nr:hypothetical protein [Candidatus Portnoybacteria bacterium]